MTRAVARTVTDTVARALTRAVTCTVTRRCRLYVPASVQDAAKAKMLSLQRDAIEAKLQAAMDLGAEERETLQQALAAAREAGVDASKIDRAERRLSEQWSI